MVTASYFVDILPSLKI